jgi:methionine-rich copper-binding protein CopC
VKDNRVKQILGIAVFLAMIGTNAVAHSEKESMKPADGAVLDNVPEILEMRFNDGMRLTKVEMTHAGTQVETLDLGAQSGFVKEFSLPLVPMGSGLYQIEWRGLGVDGHPMTGSFSFEVK